LQDYISTHLKPALPLKIYKYAQLINANTLYIENEQIKSKILLKYTRLFMIKETALWQSLYAKETYKMENFD